MLFRLSSAHRRAYMKQINAFKEFLSGEVNLNQSRIDTLEQRIGSIKTLLKDNYPGYRKTEKQGSYAMGTIIKPVQNHNEFDADILIYLKKDEDKEPADFINDLYKFFKDNKNYENIVKKKTRCITLDYSGDFHLDLVPCIEDNGDVSICNRETNEFEKTDGTGYGQWLSEKTAFTNGELKRVTRLLKYLRDHKGNFSAKSILLTTLLGNCIDDIPESDFTDTPSALLSIMKTLHQFLNAHPVMPIIENPVLPGENFNRHWDQSKYDNFRDKVKIYYERIKDAYEDEDHNSSIRKWRKVFGDKFGKLKENNSNQGSIITPRKPHSMG